jgi:GNAT superfamily N-acetyltransferase
MLPAPYHVNPEKAAAALGAREARLADEGGFAETFPDCEVGAMPPFGNLYGMPVCVDETLAEDATIVFRAGTHTDTMSVPYRAIAPDNAAALQRFHHRLSERSIYLRFFGAKPDLSDRKAGYFTNADGKDRFALVALDPEREGEIIAVVSFDREGETDRAEFAAAVEDRWQGRGLALTRRLIKAALERGIRIFTGVVLFENKRMLNLLRDLDLPETLRYEEGVEQVEIELQGPGGEEES